MKTVYKYEATVDDDGVCEVDLPLHSFILRFAFQGDKIYLWAVVDTALKVFVKRRFKIFGTGQDMNVADKTTYQYQYINTFDNDVFVFHVFEIKKVSLIKTSKDLLNKKRGGLN